MRSMGKTYPHSHPFHCNKKLMTKFKYFRLTANSITSYEHIIKVPASVTLDDIGEAEANEHDMFDGGNFSDVSRHPFNTSGDWRSDETMELSEPDDYEIKHATEYSLEELKTDDDDDDDEEEN